MCDAPTAEGALQRGLYALMVLDLGLPQRDGLVHISQISEERVHSISDELKEGDAVRVKVLEVDKQGRIRLSIKALEPGE